ncbi:MAG: F0F1 ATP synthase subunit B [Gammaproteobacteria bacterium]
MNINLTLIGQAISFAMFVWFCQKFVWPPIMKALADREAKIADGLAAAEKGKRDLEQAEARAQEVLSEARSRAQGVLAQAEKRGTEMIEEAKGAARDEAAREKAAAKAEIDQEIARAREQLREQIGALVVAGAEKILRREVDAKAHADMLASIRTQL